MGFSKVVEQLDRCARVCLVISLSHFEVSCYKKKSSRKPSGLDHTVYSGLLQHPCTENVGMAGDKDTLVYA